MFDFLIKIYYNNSNSFVIYIIKMHLRREYSMEITINYGTVIICGPTSTGKTTLSNKIYEDMPWRGRKLISHDEVLKKILKPGMTQSEIDRVFRMTCLSLMADAIRQNLPLIYEGKYYEKERLYAFLVLQSMLSPNRPICLIKMATDPKVQQEFAKKRNGMKPTTKTMHIQNNLFRGVIGTHYHDAFHNVREFVVTNPKRVELKFLN